MASKNTNSVTTVYQCSECDHCSQNLEEATVHAVQEHSEDRDDEDHNQESEDEDDDDEGESFHEVQIKKDKDELSSDEEFPSTSLSSPFNQSNGNYDVKPGSGALHNYRRTELWSPESTKELIMCVKDHYRGLKNRLLKKKHIWEQIRSIMSSKVPSITTTQCEQKWRNLLTAQKKYLNSKKVFGKSRIKKPDYFDEIADIVGEDIHKDLDYGITNENESILPFKNPKSKEFREKLSNDSLSYALQSITQEERSESFGRSLSSPDEEPLFLLSRLISILEKREAANEAFQREILEIEKEKLICAKRFVENREKQNARRTNLLKEWILNQPRAKRRRNDED